jgi:peptidyl-prolyl cis-trans isomerase-like protein 2
MIDLIDGTPFTRADIITLQDPSDGSRREIEHFSHVTENLEAGRARDEGGIRHTDATARVLSQLSGSAAEAAAAGAAGAAGVLGKAKGKAEASGASGGAANGVGKPAAKPAVALAPRWLQTTGQHSAGFTSTACTPTTRNEIAPLSEEEADRQRWHDTHPAPAFPPTTPPLLPPSPLFLPRLPPPLPPTPPTHPSSTPLRSVFSPISSPLQMYLVE